MIRQIDHPLWFKANGALRYAIARGALNKFAKPIVVAEYPKSGGTWLSQMLSEATGMPYPRNRLPLLSRQIIHGLYRKVNPNIDTVVMWRDGRDTIVSFYYHLMFPKPNTSTKYSDMVKQQIGVRDPADIVELAPRFIEWAFEGGYPGFSWTDFVHAWSGRIGHVETSYEAMTHDAAGELRKVLDAFGYSGFDRADIDHIVEEYSFANQSNRAPGEEDVTSFIRKGIVGDWQNAFNREAREVFHHYAGKELIQLGYEDDDSWVAKRSED